MCPEPYSAAVQLYTAKQTENMECEGIGCAQQSATTPRRLQALLLYLRGSTERGQQIKLWRCFKNILASFNNMNIICLARGCEHLVYF